MSARNDGLNNPRQHLLEIYKAALESVRGESCVRESLAQRDLEGSFAIVAIGKAAASMMNGAVVALGKQLDAGLIITKMGHCVDGQNIVDTGAVDIGKVEGIKCIEAGHPVPDENSLLAGKELLSFIDRQPLSRTLIFLISGGTSSLVEHLVEGVTLAHLQKLNEWLLGSGLDIETMNNVRSAISCLKGGRLANIMDGRKGLNLMISDVPGDKPHVIGSGLLSPNPDMQKSLSGGLKIEMPGVEVPGVEMPGVEVPGVEMPKWLDTLLQNTEQAPSASDACFKTVDTHVIATIMGAKQAAATAARALGYDVVLHEEVLQGDALTTGQELAHDLCNDTPALHIWGGETTVCLPENPGTGGRNQHLALAVATVLDGQDNCWILAAGTDGSDGPTDDAGALVDGETIMRGSLAGFEVAKALAEANAGAFLTASGDVVRTGPTGTNVMDLVIGLKI